MADQLGASGQALRWHRLRHRRHEVDLPRLPTGETERLRYGVAGRWVYGLGYNVHCSLQNEWVEVCCEQKAH